jgi:outer membrane protein assembly factor BamB
MKMLAMLLFIAVLILGIVTPAQATPNYIEDKGAAYVASGSGVPRVSKLDLATQSQIWLTVLQSTSTPVPPDLTLSLTLDKGVLYVVGASDTIAPLLGFIWAIDADTGQILWQTRNIAGGGVYAAATVEKSVVYIAGAATSGQSNITAIDATTGAILWGTPVGPPIFNSPTVSKGIVTSVSGGFFGFPVVVTTLDAETGAIISAFPAP